MLFFVFQTSEPCKHLLCKTSSSGRNIRNEFLNLIDLEEDICDLIDFPEGYLQQLCTTDGIIVLLWDLCILPLAEVLHIETWVISVLLKHYLKLHLLNVEKELLVGHILL